MLDYSAAIQRLFAIYGNNPAGLIKALNTLVATVVENRQRRDIEELGKLAKHIFDDGEGPLAQPLCKGQSTGVACLACYEIEMARIAGQAEEVKAPEADPDMQKIVNEALGITGGNQP